MNQFEEKIHALKVEYKANKAAVWEVFHAKIAELKSQRALISNLKGIPTPTGAIAILNEHQRMLTADRDRKLSKFGRTYHFWRKETLAEMEAFYRKGGEA